MLALGRSAQARKYSCVRTWMTSVMVSVRIVTSWSAPASSYCTVRRACVTKWANSMDSVCTSGSDAP